MKQKDVTAKMKELGFMKVTRKCYKGYLDGRDACEFTFFGQKPPYKCFTVYFKKRLTDFNSSKNTGKVRK